MAGSFRLTGAHLIKFKRCIYIGMVLYLNLNFNHITRDRVDSNDFCVNGSVSGRYGVFIDLRGQNRGPKEDIK